MGTGRGFESGIGSLDFIILIRVFSTIRPRIVDMLNEYFFKIIFVYQTF